MKWLWLAVADPEPPMNGQFVFSHGLLRAVEQHCDSVHVVAFSLPSGKHRDGERTGNIVWHLADLAPRPAWRAVFSNLPRDAFRTRVAGLTSRVNSLLYEGGWDAVIFETPRLGWALRHVRAICPAAVTAYISHNHEETVARSTVSNEGHPIKRLAHFIDLQKVKRFERSLAREVDLVTGTSEEDREKFSAVRRPLAPAPVVSLTPGYSRPHVLSRTISADIPRRVVIIGSLDWVPKRQAFEEFFSIADPKFAEADIELYVVGGAPEEYLNSLRRRARATVFTGQVQDVSVFMKDARIGLVIENVGGFKLKTLDYVFNRLPIFAQRGSLPGIPLHDGESAMLFDTYEDLVQSILVNIENFALLNLLQDVAYTTCKTMFDWREIGSQLVEAVSRLIVRKSDHSNFGSKLIRAPMSARPA